MVDDEKTFSHFKGIKVDGQPVADEHFDARSGSVVVSIGPAYLETLSVGVHTLAACFDDSDDVAATFTIATAANKDDDENSQSGGSGGTGDNTGGGSSSNNEGGGAESTPTGGEGNVSSGGGSESGGDGAAANVAASDSAKGSNATRGTGATSAASKQSVPRAGDGLPSVVPFAAVLALLLALALLPVAAARHRSR